MPVTAAKKKIAKSSKKPVKKTKGGTSAAFDEFWKGLKEMRETNQELQQMYKEAEQERLKAEQERLKTEQERKKAHEEIEAAIKKTQEAHQETEAAIKKTQEAQRETEAAIKKTQANLDRLGNRQGEIAEAMLVPDLLEKFDQFGFSFREISRRRRIKDENRQVIAEVDAFLENGKQVMLVEVKTTLLRRDISSHIERIEKVRDYAEANGKKWEYYGAMAALVVDEETRREALRAGFYLIEPSGEDITITPPVPNAKSW